MSKPEPELSHMPWHIRQKIVDKVASLETKLMISHISKDLQYRVSQSPFDYETLKISLQPDLITVKATILDIGCWANDMKVWELEFHPHEKGAMKKNPKNNWEKLLEGEDYREAAVQFALGIFQNPKVYVKNLKLEVNRSVDDNGYRQRDRDRDPEDNRYPASYPKAKFEEDREIIAYEFFKTLHTYKFELLIGKFYCKFEIPESQIIPIMVHLDYIEMYSANFHIEFPRRNEHEDAPKPVLAMDTLSKMTFWRGGTRMRLQDYACEVGMEDWEHFEKLELTLTRATSTVKQILGSFLRHPKFQSLNIQCLDTFDFTDIDEYLDGMNLEDETSRQNDDDPNIYSTFIRQDSEPTKRIFFKICRDIENFNITLVFRRDTIPIRP